VIRLVALVVVRHEGLLRSAEETRTLDESIGEDQYWQGFQDED
jgi:hypothetical protein